MTHTPGKWEAISGVLNGEHILVRGGDYAVAKVYNQEEGMEATNEANARLIAAAPCLLEALENLLIHISMGWEIDILLVNGNDAVKRARGEAA